MTLNSLYALLGAAFGLAVGSFVATLVQRWGEGRSVRGRSCCDGCGRQLRAAELIPLLGFLLVRGRCRSCSAAIDRRFPLTELVAALIGGSALALQPGWAGVAAALFGWSLLTLALLDAHHFWLPDRLTLSLLVAGLAAGRAGIAPAVADRAIGAVAGYAALAVVAFVYRRWRGREGLGGGDPKLFAAIGAWLGWAALPTVLFASALLALLFVVASGLRGRVWSATDRLPFGVFLAVAAFGVEMFSAATV